jgi:roadblock/LC7 domain-containing protein
MQEAAAELSALITRAQQLMGKMDASQTAAFSSMFGSTPLGEGDLFVASGGGKRQLPGGLAPVDEVRC